MPYVMTDLVIDRVDLVDEGANSAAFIELYKRKEGPVMEMNEILEKMKPEHREIVEAEINKAKEDATKANEELAKANESITSLTKRAEDAEASVATLNSELEKAKSCECDGEADENGTCKECGKTKKSVAKSADDVIKGLDPEAKALFEKMKLQKDAAEAEIAKAKAAEDEAKAIAKAKELKALPVDEAKLAGILKSASPEVVEMLSTIAAGIDGAVLGEVGKAADNAKGGDAWSKIESKAAEIAKAQNVSIQKATQIAITENPDMYREYLEGGAQ